MAQSSRFGGAQGMKRRLQRRFPTTAAVARRLRSSVNDFAARAVQAGEVRFRYGSMEGRFKRIVRANHWRGHESRSGPGSGLEETEAVRRELPRLLRETNTRVLLDAPCGDFYWMSMLDLDVDLYIGADVLADLIRQNGRRFGSERRRFIRLDLTRDRLPNCDLVLCRDCLDHLSFSDARRALHNIACSSARFVLLTTYPLRNENTDVQTGGWRPLNLLRPPFNLPPPEQSVLERVDRPGYPEKLLGLWRKDVLSRSLSSDDWSGLTKTES